MDRLLRGNGTFRPSGDTTEITKDEPQVVVDLAEGDDPSVIKDALKNLAYEEDFPKLTDLITTRDRKVIVKTKSPDDAERVGEKLRGVSLAEGSQVKISKYRKQRLIAFGVPDTLTKENFVCFINDIPRLGGHPVEIVRSFAGRPGRINYIFDVDQYIKNYFRDNP